MKIKSANGYIIISVVLSITTNGIAIGFAF